MSGQALFIRKTTLAPEEYRANFTITDNEIIDTITSAEALGVTTLMPAIYLRLQRAPLDLLEREGVLRFTGTDESGEEITAWAQLRRLTGVSNSTLSKAIKWLHNRGVIGYDAHKNGIGIRIFLNRAASSIRLRTGQKNSFCKFSGAVSGLKKTGRAKVNASTGGNLWHVSASFWKTTMAAK